MAAPPPPEQAPQLQQAPQVQRQECTEEAVSPKRRAREAMLARAKREALPLKVRMPAEAVDQLPRRDLDPAVPVKKRPVFAQLFPTITEAALKKLQPGEPVKKRPTGFLLKDPPR